MTDQKMLVANTPDKDCGIPTPVVMYPHPSTKSCAEKLGIFTLGVVTGAIALGVTAAVVENLDRIISTFGNDLEGENGKSNQILDVLPIDKNR